MDNNMNEKIRNLIDDIKKPLKEIQQFQNKRLDFVKSKIQHIIINKVNDKQEIERLLDELLEIAYWDSKCMKKSFDKLVGFYKKIDVINAKQYEKYYMEIIKEDVEEI